MNVNQMVKKRQLLKPLLQRWLWPHGVFEDSSFKDAAARAICLCRSGARKNREFEHLDVSDGLDVLSETKPKFPVKFRIFEARPAN